MTNIGSLTPSLLLGLIWLSVAIAILFTIIRTAIRIRVYRHLFADDGAVYLALTILVSMGVMYQIITPTMFELERLLTPGAVPSANFVQEAALFLKLQFAIIILFWTTLWAVKLSFLLYCRTLFAGLPNQLFWWWLVSVFAGMAYLGCWATQLASCAPISNYFHLGACETKRDIWVSNFSLYYATAVDILCDLLIMALPLRLLWDLQINRQQKSVLAAIFSLGFVVIVFAIVRVIETSASIHHVDPIWLALWSMIEASVAVVVSCLPSFRVWTRASRSASAYNRRNVSTSRSRSHCSSKRAWRLKPIKHGATSFGSGGHGGGDSLPTKHYAGAERVGPFAADHEAEESAREDGSKEYILPKIPREGVDVRSDVMVDFN